MWQIALSRFPPGSPYIQDGKDSIVEQLAKELEESELADDTTVNVEEKGVVVSFSARAFFEAESTKMNEKAKKEFEKFAQLINFLPNKIQVEGHTDNTPPQKWKSNWELSGARAAVVARFLSTAGVDGKKNDG